MKKLTENIEKNLIFMVVLSFAFADERVLFSGVPIYLPEALVIVALAIYCFRFFLQKSTCWKPVPKGILLSSGLILFGVVSSAVANGMDSDALGAIKSWFVFPMLFALILYQAGFSEKDVWKVVFFWFFGVSVVSFGALFVPGFSSETYDGRIRSIFPSPNHFAFFLEYGAVIGIGIMILLRKNPYAFLFVALAETMVVAALFLTRSDGALLAAATGAVALFSAKIFPTAILKKMLVWIIFSLIFSVLFLAVSIDWEALGSGSVRTSLASRVMVWNASFHMLAESPLFGIGPRNFQNAYLAVQPEFPPYLEWAVPHPHNLLLSFWLFCGLIGMFGLVTLLYSLFQMMLRCAPRLSLLHSIFLALIFTLLMHGSVDTPYFRNDLSYALFTVVACVATLSKIRRSAETLR